MRSRSHLQKRTRPSRLVLGPFNNLQPASNLNHGFFRLVHTSVYSIAVENRRLHKLALFVRHIGLPRRPDQFRERLPVPSVGDSLPVAYVSGVALRHAESGGQCHGRTEFRQLRQHISYIAPAIKPAWQTIRIPLLPRFPLSPCCLRSPRLCLRSLRGNVPVVRTIALVRANGSTANAANI